jgi:two-component system phosphate regulon sensor histidine kinase PhoR
MGNQMLLHNALWFTKIRWIVVVVFVLTGVIGSFFPEKMTGLGLIPAGRWPWAFAGILLLMNTLFALLGRRLSDKTPAKAVRANLWMQIMSDLFCVTILVHIVGSTQTFVPFTYLFHIILACIFFTPKHSLLVTGISAALYISCVFLELKGLWPSTGILLDVPRSVWQNDRLAVVFATSAILVWTLVWYLVSTLSGAVRRRDQRLNSMNDQLIMADKEKNLQVLRTTHDLKAPFTGIDSNIQILKLQHWDSMSDPVKEIIEKIDVRALTLSERIKDILTLGNLRSQEESAETTTVDLQALITGVVEDVSETAKEKNVSVNVNMESSELLADEKQLVTLFSNIVANAVFYSHDGSSVDISSTTNADKLQISVADHGIGISDEALPHIFDEYFSSTEAVRFNRRSTGLGLAIVKRIASNLGLKVRVTSELENGTTFTVIITKKT